MLYMYRCVWYGYRSMVHLNRVFVSVRGLVPVSLPPRAGGSTLAFWHLPAALGKAVASVVSAISLRYQDEL